MVPSVGDVYVGVSVDGDILREWSAKKRERGRKEVIGKVHVTKQHAIAPVEPIVLQAIGQVELHVRFYVFADLQSTST